MPPFSAQDVDRDNAVGTVVRLARADIEYWRTIGPFIKEGKFVGSEADEMLVLSVLLLKTVGPDIEFVLDQYTLNVAFGLLTVDEAIEGLEKFLRRQLLAAVNGQGHLVRRYQSVGSHIEFELYNGVKLKPTLRQAARSLLGTIPVYDDPCLEFSRVIHDMRDRIKSLVGSSFVSKEAVMARLVTESVLMQQAAMRVVRAALRRTG